MDTCASSDLSCTSDSDCSRSTYTEINILDSTCEAIDTTTSGCTIQQWCSTDTSAYEEHNITNFQRIHVVLDSYLKSEDKSYSAINSTDK